MMKNAKCFNDDSVNVLNKLYESCVTCLKFKKSQPKPKVAPPMANDFNECVCMDLKIWPKKGVIILYLIDMFTRFTVARIIPDKTPESIIKVFMDNWILNLFGAPVRILFDNGKEFWNQKMRDLCHNFNIRFHSTGAHSPFQNGMCERNHSQVDLMMSKMMEDQPNLPVDMALSHSIFAKNMLVNAKGYSPMQLVFGKQPKLPSAIDNSPPAMECVSEVEAVRNRLNAIFDARKAFIQVENSKKLNEALKVKTMPKMEFYEPGDLVYYKHGLSPYWSGPAKIIGVDNKVIMLRQGRFILSTSQSRVMKANPQVETSSKPVANRPMPANNQPKQIFPPKDQSEKTRIEDEDDSSDDDEDEPIRGHDEVGDPDEANQHQESEDHVEVQDQVAGEEGQADPDIDDQELSDNSLDLSNEARGILQTCLI